MEMDMQRLMKKIDEKKEINSNGAALTSAALSGKRVERIPIIFRNKYLNGIPGKTYSFKEQFYDKRKMLFSQLEEMAEVNYIGDAQLAIRPNFGTIFIPAMFGLEYRMFENQFPWISSHLNKKDIASINIDKMFKHEILNKALEYIEFFQSELPPYIHVYLPDTQGPFDIAHMVYGDEIFYALYDDEGFVLELMEITTEVFIKVSQILKEALGEKTNEMWHGHALSRGIYMDCGGVRVSEDSATLISPEQIDKFVLPYVNKALSSFEGGFVHYCGRSEPFLTALMESEYVRAINFGNPDMHDFTSVMQMFLDNGKCCFGAWPKNEEETIQAYSERIIKATLGGTKGLVLHLDADQFPEYTEKKLAEIFLPRES